MAGTFTHWMVVEEALDNKVLPQKEPVFFYLFSVSIISSASVRSDLTTRT